MRSAKLHLFLGFALAFACGCGPRQEPQAPKDELLRQEGPRLEALSRLTPQEYEDLGGTDPYRILRLENPERFLALLRNSSEVLLLDSSLNLLDRQPTSLHPTAWDLSPDQATLMVAGASAEMVAFQIRQSRLQADRVLELPETCSIRDLVFSPAGRAIFLLDDFDSRLLRLELARDGSLPEPGQILLDSLQLPAGPLQIRQLDGHLFLNLLLDHSLLILPLADDRPELGRASRIRHDGPFWSLEVVKFRDALWIAAGGIENRPLDRSQGEFGSVDSFLYLFSPRLEGGVYRWLESDRLDPSTYQEFNLSQIGIVTPKGLSWERTEDGMKLWVSGYGSEKLSRFGIENLVPTLEFSLPIPPGTQELLLSPWGQPTRVSLVNPILDQVLMLEGSSGDVQARWKSDPRPPVAFQEDYRLGEALFYSTLLTPENQSQGPLSRFTCEACHFEGGGDGRIHFTGRHSLHAVSKPLAGLGANLPLFSRGGDATLTSMVLSEFQVANQERRSEFSLGRGEHPWLEQLGELPEIATAADLRRAFLTYFAALRHPSNPWRRLRGDGLSPKAKAGLPVFRDRCAGCHLARTSNRAQESRPYQEWEEWLTGDQDLIWGATFFAKTGIQPYVDEAGARVPSLRRVWRKRPYFTNGSSPDLAHLLSRFRYQGVRGWHHREGDEARALTSEEVEVLEALLRYF